MNAAARRRAAQARSASTDCDGGTGQPGRRLQPGHRLGLCCVKAVLIFVFLLVATLLVIWFERRVVGRMQQRPGPEPRRPVRPAADASPTA